MHELFVLFIFGFDRLVREMTCFLYVIGLDWDLSLNVLCLF